MASIDYNNLPQPLPVYNTENELIINQTMYRGFNYLSGIHNQVSPADGTRPSNKFNLVPLTITNGAAFTFTKIELVNCLNNSVIDITTAITGDSMYSTINGVFYFRIFGKSAILVPGLSAGIWRLRFTSPTFNKFSEAFQVDALTGLSPEVFSIVATPGNVTRFAAGLGLLFAGTSDGGGLWSFNGTDWTKELSGVTIISDLVLFQNDIYAIEGKNIRKRNGGAWNVIKTSDSTCTSIAATPNFLLIGRSDGKIDEYSNYTSTWIVRNNGGLNIIRDMAATGNNIFIAEGAKILWFEESTVNPGDNKIVNNFHTAVGTIRRIEVIDGICYFLPGARVWSFPVSGLPSPIITSLYDFHVRYIPFSIAKLSDGKIYITTQKVGTTVYELHVRNGNNFDVVRITPERLNDLVLFGGNNYGGGTSKIFKINL